MQAKQRSQVQGVDPYQVTATYTQANRQFRRGCTSGAAGLGHAHHTAHQLCGETPRHVGAPS